MKKTLFLILALAVLILPNAKAQSISLSVGQGISVNTQNLNLDYLFSSKKNINFGISFKSITQQSGSFGSLFKGTDGVKPVTNLILACGLLANYNLYSNRNFEFESNFGAYLGGDGVDYVYFPEISFKEVFYISPRIKLHLSESLNYFFMKRYIQKFNPHLSFGFSFLF